MKKYLAMIEVLGEGGELQPLLWDPNHLVAGRAILIVDEKEGRIWVWLGEGTTIIQRTTALRQTRFIMVNGFSIENVLVGTKCTNFIEISGNLDESIANALRKLLKEYSKTSQYLIVVEEEEKTPVADDAFQRRVDAIAHTITPEPIRQPPPIKRRMLSYEEQLASKVLFAVSDCYGYAIMKPLGPNRFEVSTRRLNARFHCDGDAILFSLILAAAQDDIDSFTNCYGQPPQFDATGQQIIDPSLGGVTVTREPEEEKEPMSLTEKMRRQLHELSERTVKEEKEELEESEEPEISEESSSKEEDDEEARDEEFYF
ncbi:MAG: hypothetical protein ACFFDP_05280 [Promethearchaeota archaeon]